MSTPFASSSACASRPLSGRRRPTGIRLQCRRATVASPRGDLETARALCAARTELWRQLLADAQTSDLAARLRSPGLQPPGPPQQELPASHEAAELAAARDPDHHLARAVIGRADPPVVPAVYDAWCRVQGLRQRMALENSGLVVAMARRYAARGLDRADLLQEGQLGLMRAVDRFDPRLGYRFSTYAVWWVRHAMERAVRKQVALVRIPIPAHDASLRLRRLAAQTLAEHGRSPDEAELRAIGITPRQARRLELLPAASTTVPLEGHELEPHGVAPRALVDSACSADERVAAIELRALLGRALMRLPDRELAVLERRFALDGGAEETLQQIGKRMQLSRERIRQIEASALRRLRSALATA